MKFFLADSDSHVDESSAPFDGFSRCGSGGGAGSRSILAVPPKDASSGFAWTANGGSAGFTSCIRQLSVATRRLLSGSFAFRRFAPFSSTTVGHGGHKMALTIDLVGVVVVTIFCFILKYRWQNRRLVKMVNSFGGPPTLPIVGNALTFATSTKGKLAFSLVFMANLAVEVCSVFLGVR